MLINKIKGTLSGTDLVKISNKLRIQLAPILFKSQLRLLTPKTNLGYIINMDNEYDIDGNENQGTHYVSLFVSSNNGVDKIMFFDPYGLPPPSDIILFANKFKKNNTTNKEIPFIDIKIQHNKSDYCGWWCIYFIWFVIHNKSNYFYKDCDRFIQMFIDLNHSNNYQHNRTNLEKWVIQYSLNDI
jgi:hypothetical protein